MIGPATVVLRCDASARIGRGHVARCRAVAVALRQRGIPVLLLSFEIPQLLLAGFREIGCTAIDLASRTDAAEVVQILKREGVADRSAAMLVDHYGLDVSWEAAVRTVVGRLVALEDRPHRRHDVDVLVDAGGGDERPIRYAELLPEDAQIVTGHDHAIVDPFYGRLQQRLPVRQGAIRRVLVQLGSDRSDLVECVVEGLATLGVSRLQVDVVIPGDHPSRLAVEELSAEQHWRVHCDVAGIGELYALVDLAIAAPGVSVWERCALGVPSVIIETSAMHTAAYEDLGASPAVTRLGPADRLDDASLREALGREIERDDLWTRSVACRSLIDGRGAQRVASLLTTDASSACRLRDVTPQDGERLRRWANDRHTRAWSFRQAQIDPAEHSRWFTSQLCSIADRQLYILEDAWGTEFGIARFERRREEPVWKMSATLAPGYRARGLAEVIVDLSRRQLVEDVGTPCTIVATVRTLRPGAGRVLDRLGFEIVADQPIPGAISYRWAAQ